MINAISFNTVSSAQYTNQAQARYNQAQNSVTENSNFTPHREHPIWHMGYETKQTADAIKNAKKTRIFMCKL